MTLLSKPSLILLLCLTLAACTRPGDDRTSASRDGAGNWKRDQRSFVYLSERRARYAGITRTAQGRLLILFTHQTAQQERDGSESSTWSAGPGMGIGGSIRSRSSKAGKGNPGPWAP